MQAPARTKAFAFHPALSSSLHITTHHAHVLRRCRLIHRRSRQCSLQRTCAVQKTASEDVSFSDKKAAQGLIFDAEAVGPTDVQTARPATQETDVVVIGSGIGGLCCAALLAKYGLKVCSCSGSCTEDAL